MSEEFMLPAGENCTRVWRVFEYAQKGEALQIRGYVWKSSL